MGKKNAPQPSAKPPLEDLRAPRAPAPPPPLLPSREQCASIGAGLLGWAGAIRANLAAGVSSAAQLEAIAKDCERWAAMFGSVK